MLDYVLNISLLALGFGFVIFWHELGHFLAAKYVGIKVEQFAVGFGQAVLAWRKGIGIRIGTTRPEYERRINEHLAAREQSELKLRETGTYSTEQVDRAAADLKLGDTEYRLNWIPLGGYVKMLGQDDMNPNAVSADPRAYPQKSVGARMLVISAGVIMNVILAAVLFMILFMMGHRVPPAIVGGIGAGSPAQRVTHTVDGKPVVTSLRVGDRILSLDGKPMQDWTKIGLSVALSAPNTPIPIEIQHVDGAVRTYMIAPEVDPYESRGFLALGVQSPRSLAVPPTAPQKDPSDKGLELVDFWLLDRGETITHVNGKPVGVNDAHVLDDAVQQAGLNGQPVRLTVQPGENSGVRGVHDVLAHPTFKEPFAGNTLQIAGMMPRTTVVAIKADSPARDQLRPGDVVRRLVSANDPVNDPTFAELTVTLNRAGQRGAPVEMTVIRGDDEETFAVNPSVKVAKDRYGLSFQRGYDADHPVVAGTTEGSAAQAAGIPKGARILSVSGTEVGTWHDVRRLLLEAPAGHPVKLELQVGDERVTKELTLAPEQHKQVADIRYYLPAADLLGEQKFKRIADNPLQAAAWGVTETRDFILQFYLTLQRMFGGSVSPKNLMGPVGIFSAGTQFAFKGTDWLIWFLAMISANLAVVNFLPIPVVDGGHFVFLLLEKIQGKPVSQKTQSIAQVVGLALLLGVFLLVTYQDISRMISPF
jgi:regulator of sigma E protease